MQRTPSRLFIIGGALASAVIVLASVSYAGWWPDQPAPTPTPASVAAADMRVVSVADASELLAKGALNGRAIAIAGFWAELFPSCPAPFRNFPPLENGCHSFVTLADVPFNMCRPFNGGVECGGDVLGSVGPTVSPREMRETSNHRSGIAPGPMGQAVAVVVIAHSMDPRFLHCSPEARVECGRSLIVDYVGDPNAANLDVQPRTELRPGMAWPEAAAAAGAPPESVIVAAPVIAREVSTIDPRFNVAGDSLVWLLRWIAPADPDTPTRHVTVAVVDDATGAVLGKSDLAVTADFQPARLSIEVARPEGATGTTAFFNIVDGDRTEIASGRIVGSSWTRGGVTLTYADAPVILDAGDYTVSVWLGRAGQAADRLFSCSEAISLAALDNIGLRAVFPGNGPCDLIFVPPDQPFM